MNERQTPTLMYQGDWYVEDSEPPEVVYDVDGEQRTIATLQCVALEDVPRRAAAARLIAAAPQMLAALRRLAETSAVHSDACAFTIHGGEVACDCYLRDAHAEAAAAIAAALGDAEAVAAIAAALGDDGGGA